MSELMFLCTNSNRIIWWIFGYCYLLAFQTFWNYRVTELDNIKYFAITAFFLAFSLSLCVCQKTFSLHCVTLFLTQESWAPGSRCSMMSWYTKCQPKKCKPMSFRWRAHGFYSPFHSNFKLFVYFSVNVCVCVSN